MTNPTLISLTFIAIYISSAPTYAVRGIPTVLSPNCSKVEFYINHELPNTLANTYDYLLVKKSDRILIAFNQNTPQKVYSISIGQNTIGKKQKRGDLKTPEGTYIIDQKNSKSQYYLGLHISYPNSLDKKLAEKKSLNPGDGIYLHGFPIDKSLRNLANKTHWTTKNWTEGCIAVTDEEIEEIFNKVESQIPIQICP